MATLNFDGLKETFDRDGFVVIRGYLSPEELAQMRGELSRYQHHVDGWQADFGKGGAVKGMDHHDDWYRNYLLAGRHIPLVEVAGSTGSRRRGLQWHRTSCSF